MKSKSRKLQKLRMRHRAQHRSRREDEFPSLSRERHLSGSSSCSENHVKSKSRKLQKLKTYQSVKSDHGRDVRRRRHNRYGRSSSTSSISSSVSSSMHEKEGCTSITVAAVQHSADGKRIRNKKLVCFVCRAEVIWLSRHLEKQHSEHFLVAQVFAKTGLSRQTGLKRLKNLGSFIHNIDVLKSGSGQLLVTRRPKAQPSAAADSYLPCSECYGFYHKYELWRHKCPSQGNVSVSNHALDNARSLLEGALDGSDSFVDEHLNKQVLCHMRKDNMLRTVKSDTLILKFGSAQLKRIGVKGARTVATRMRLLARLLNCLRSRASSSGIISLLVLLAQFTKCQECIGMTRPPMTCPPRL